MNIKLLVTLFAILFLAAAGPAQINLKLPKIVPISRDKSPAKENGRDSSGKSSNRQMVIDDGFTFFDAEPLQEYSTQLSVR